MDVKILIERSSALLDSLKKFEIKLKDRLERYKDSNPDYVPKLAEILGEKTNVQM